MTPKEENIFIPLPMNIMKVITWWKDKSMPGVYKDKGGSFNLDLYLDYLQVINEQVQTRKNYDTKR